MYAGTALSTICGTASAGMYNSYDDPDVLFNTAQELVNQHTPVIVPANSSVTLTYGLYYAVINATVDSSGNKM